ncbi:hypothetical protein OG598_24990 [Micromonospora sp. NBC_00330]|uniref:hypothetical protein n=1 Tax=Micromonospora sp. NBC_00330 TaxID=2903585 RepID=UPI002E2BACA4|nr:hypothetical protein [Micromonospora sp. NBC_00330]
MFTLPTPAPPSTPPTTGPSPTPNSVPPVIVNVSDPDPNLWEIINSVGAFSAAVISLIAILVTIKVTQDQARRQVRADEEAAAEKRKSYEVGLLRELLDAIPSADDDRREAAERGRVPAVITHQHYVLLSLLPNAVLPLWRRLAVVLGRGLPHSELLKILDEADAPQTFEIRGRVRRAQRREVLEAIQERTGGNPHEVGEWMNRLDGQAEIDDVAT